jgi:hypothetical protein
MYAKVILLTGLLAAWAPGQTRQATTVYNDAELAAAGSGIRLFYPTGIKTPQDLQEMVNAIRTITDIQQMYALSQPAAIAARGTTAQLEAAEWLIRNLEPDANGRKVAATKVEFQDRPEYRSPELRVLRSPLFGNAKRMQEITNAIRTIGDVQRIFPYGGAPALALRGDAAQMALAEWMVATMEKAPPAPAAAMPKPEIYSFNDARTGPSEVRIFFPSRLNTPQALQETINAIRTITNVQRIFPVAEPAIITARGTPAQMAITEWLIREPEQRDGNKGQ